MAITKAQAERQMALVRIDPVKSSRPPLVIGRTCL
jgi:hypothetical protein